MFDTIPMHATVVIGEGEMDEAPMLYIGEELGLRNGGPEVDIAVDPLEGTNIVAKGTNGAMTVLSDCRSWQSFKCTRYVYGKNCGRTRSSR